MTRTTQAPDNRAIAKAAADLVNLLKNHPDGLYADQVHALVGPYVQQAAAWLRESGVAVVATRQRQNTKWYLLPIASERYQQWLQRYLRDHYVATVRGHQATVNHPNQGEIARSFQKAAVDAGAHLGYSLIQINEDLQPVPFSGALAEMLIAEGYMPPTNTTPTT